MADPSSRRPLKSRQSALAVKLARWLTARSVTPNQISVSSMVFAALAALFLWLGGSQTGGTLAVTCLILAALFCQLRLLANLFDGMVAVEGGKAEPDGPFWNETPDRVSDVLIIAALGYAAGQPALGWAVACLAVGAAYLREHGTACGLEADFSGPMAKQHRMALVTGAAILAALCISFIAPSSLFFFVLIAMTLGLLLTLFRRSQNLLANLKARG